MNASKKWFASVSSNSEQHGFFEVLFRRSRSAFFRQVDRGVVVLSHGPVARLRPVLQAGLIDNLDLLQNLATNHSQSIRAGFLDNHGILEYRAMNQAEREQITSARLGLFIFDGLERHFSSLREMLVQACQDFGYPTFGAHCLGFFHTPRATLPRHCDELDVIVIQLFGSRRWWIERNSDPPVGISEPLRATSLSGELADPKFGASTKVIELRPGSVLYLPAGHWHQTYARSYSFSLTLGLPGPVAESIRQQKKIGRRRGDVLKDSHELS